MNAWANCLPPSKWGKLVMVRDKGDHFYTHHPIFQAPMSLALAEVSDVESLPAGLGRGGAPKYRG
jgi:hypothetical protein